MEILLAILAYSDLLENYYYSTTTNPKALQMARVISIATKPQGPNLFLFLVKNNCNVADFGYNSCKIGFMKIYERLIKLHFI